MGRRLAPVVFGLGALVGAAGCRTNRPVPPVGTPAVGPDTAAQRLAREAATRDSLARLARERAARDSAEAARAGADAAALEAARSTLTAPVYFAYDASELSDDTRAKLDAKLAILQRLPTVTLRIAGHTDSRGAAEYNLALGLRRASAARKYLVDRGIAASRLDVVSFGAERPAAAGEGEDAWAQNRRDEFEVTGGGASLGRGR
jgi:peptidoglycan-associated lipoprotein